MGELCRSSLIPILLISRSELMRVILQDGSLRFTVSEQRYSESSKHDHSVELCSPALNQLLADYALDQAQGKKGRWEREKVRGWVEKLVEFGEGLVEQQEADEEESDEVASGLVLVSLSSSLCRVRR